MLTTAELRMAMDDAMHAPGREAATGRQVAAMTIARAEMARRVQDAHDKIRRDAADLILALHSLIERLDAEGVGASLSTSFAAKARTLSGDIIRCTEARKAFECVESFLRAESAFLTSLPPPRVDGRDLSAAMATSAAGEGEFDSQENDDEIQMEETED